ncbi:mitochondrial assembly of ribosomal large subunit protein 1 [Puntigrus tetrazona]|uniref:mitochondrial assembly of ribosomal large subunit protein 1 n=1 Tax=Puntigrus tetrazona TaxID=1606681 RepID=UPI001C8A0AD7|nr:mitochondrial assembly of ribosomal large subunit protein 1 [Puntigrus tetrazona]
MIAARRVGSVASCFRRSITDMFINIKAESQMIPRRAQDYTTSAERPESGPRSPPQKLDVSLLVSLLKLENAADICVIRTAPELRYTEHMIIASGSSSRHLSAVAELLLRAFKLLRRDEDGFARLEGRDCDDWKCIDFGWMVLHLMLPDTREKYELEKLWTLRSYDEQLKRIPPETLPSDFIYDISHTHTHTHTPERLKPV